jgi:peptidoglycan-associated lipoprotein
MKVSRHLRVSFITVFALCLVVALSACSKKDVTEGEPGFTTEGGGAALGEGGETGTAADSGTTNASMQTALFPYDSYKLTNAARTAIQANADWMKANPSASVQIEGHCDDRGTTEYNLALGERRANAALEYMVKLGVEKSRLSTISYGEERPVAQGADESAWSQNRRAEFVVLSQ